MDPMKRLMYQVREYWYMGSMLARSAMQKNRMEEWTAIGVYPMRVSSIFFSVSSAIAWVRARGEGGSVRGVGCGVRSWGEG